MGGPAAVPTFPVPSVPEPRARAAHPGPDTHSCLEAEGRGDDGRSSSTRPLVQLKSKHQRSLTQLQRLLTQRLDVCCCGDEGGGGSPMIGGAILYVNTGSGSPNGANCAGDLVLNSLELQFGSCRSRTPRSDRDLQLSAEQLEAAARRLAFESKTTVVCWRRLVEHLWVSAVPGGGAHASQVFVVPQS